MIEEKEQRWTLANVGAALLLALLAFLGATGALGQEINVHEDADACMTKCLCPNSPDGVICGSSEVPWTACQEECGVGFDNEQENDHDQSDD